jgi:nitrous oxidase accessory protein NosD
MRASFVFYAAFCTLLAGCALRPSPEPSEKVWKGNISVRGVELVPEGTTLIIRPGTRVSFAFLDEDGDGWGDSGLRVKGRVLALGTRELPVVFKAEGSDTQPGRWGEILIESPEGSVFRNCRFRGAQWGLHAHFTSLRVEASSFTDNIGGVRFRGGAVEIYGNSFVGNGTAIRYWESSPEIISNIIQGNGTGIFCRQGSAETLVRGNNFIRNVDYHIKLGELQEKDIDAKFNYWGGSRPEMIEEKVFDRKDVAYLGRVIYDPVEADPFPLEGVRDASPGRNSPGRNK